MEHLVSIISYVDLFVNRIFLYLNKEQGYWIVCYRMHAVFNIIRQKIDFCKAFDYIDNNRNDVNMWKSVTM